MAPLSLVGVQKQFGTVVAVGGVTVSFGEGRLTAVVGENGAGKSTLLRIGAGILAPDSGTVMVFGEKLSPHTAGEALRRGVAMVPQHFALVDALTGLENLMLGREETGMFGWLRPLRLRERALSLASEYGLEVPLDCPAGHLGVGDRQRLELLRCLLSNAKVLILDEPTAVLAPTEADGLYRLLRRLAASGTCVVVVTHKLDEVRHFADEVVVLRGGALVLSEPLPDAAERYDFMAKVSSRAMGDTVGLAPRLSRRRSGLDTGDALSLSAFRIHEGEAGVTLRVRKGEVVGVAGVEGNGQAELLSGLGGLVPTFGEATYEGLVLVYGDRHKEGLVLDASLLQNVLLGELGAFSGQGPLLSQSRMRSVAKERLARTHVVPANLDLPAVALSGGNQQKLVMARAIARVRPGAAVVVAHPTRGVDPGACRVIRSALSDCADDGAGVLVVGSDVAELRELCDRILVLRRGAIVADLPPTVDDGVLGAAMLGLATAKGEQAS